MHARTNLLATAMILSLLFPFAAQSMGYAPVAGATDVLFSRGKPFEQNLVITAYYSPLPDQCCYVRGNFLADVELNGEGHHGADGTKVYAGMAAAPPSYPFGTRIVLPGIGTVTVHDRGGAIRELQNAHRLDIWAGHGEEGLARALAFGVRRVRAIVYPPGAQQPEASFDLAGLDAPPDKLRPYLADSTTLLDIHAKAGDRSASVQFLQERLLALDYFDAKPNGSFGPATRAGLRKFYDDMAVRESDDFLTERGASLIEAAYLRAGAHDPITATINEKSSAARIAEAQRALRFLGFYKGRTNGQYDRIFKHAVLAFQRGQGIVSSGDTPGAGQIGPKTKDRMVRLWRRKHAERVAHRLLELRKIDKLIAKRGDDLRRFLGRGDSGPSVRALQKFLIGNGYLNDVATGKFGAKTELALIAYQRDAGIIAGDGDPGAGYAGPATLARYRQDVRKNLLQIVRAKGWNAI